MESLAHRNEIEYLNLGKKVLLDGNWQDDPNRKGTKRLNHTYSTLQFKNNYDFPILFTKDVNFNNILVELLWFLRGETNIKYLIDNGCNIWNKDAYNYYLRCKKHMESSNIMSIDDFIGRIRDGNMDTSSYWYKLGDLGPVYGAQWRGMNSRVNSPISKDNITIVDPLEELVLEAARSPLSSSLVLSAWNHEELPLMALKPCHFSFQLMMREMSKDEVDSIGDSPYLRDDTNYAMDLVWSQRSVDYFLGLPYNIASYAILQRILGLILNVVPNNLYADLRNVHIYDNAENAVREQLGRFNLHEGHFGWRYLEFNEHLINRIKEEFFNGGKLDFSIIEDPKDFCRLINYESLGRLNVPMLPYKK